MRALVVEKLAPDYAGCVVKTIPAPDPGPGEVRIRVRAAAVNFPDLMQTRGEHQHKPPVPFTPGMELAGDVDAVGEGVTAFKPGDPVCGGGRVRSPVPGQGPREPRSHLAPRRRGQGSAARRCGIRPGRLAGGLRLPGRPQGDRQDRGAARSLEQVRAIVADLHLGAIVRKIAVRPAAAELRPGQVAIPRPRARA